MAMFICLPASRDGKRALFSRDSYYMHAASLRRLDERILAQVTTSSPSDECWDQPISPYPTMQYPFSRKNIYLKRQNQTVQWSV